MEPNNDAAREAARLALATNAPAARTNTDELANRFAYHAPLSDTRRQAHENIRGQIGRLAQFVVHTVPAGREQALAVTKLEEAMMWANAGLARAEDPEAAELIVLTPVEKAQRAYDAYGAVTEHKNFQGDPMPAWADLGDTIQAAWVAAANIGGNL